jgi:hypothetical protein
MSSQIDFRTLPASVPVLCIPRVYPNITEARIRRIFDDLNMGELDRIDVVNKTSEKGDKFNRVFVHFKKWNNSENSNTARERLLNGKEIKIIYDDPWFWKISAYREAATRKESGPQQHPSGNARKPTIAFDSDEERPSRPSNSTNRDERRRDDRHRDERPRRSDSRERPRADRRRDDSRERPRRDERRRDDRPRRRDDSRERPRRDERPRHDERPRQEDKPVRKSVDPDSPSTSPQRERQDKDAVIQTPLDYGNIMPPPRRGQNGGKKPEPKVLKIEKEDGEVSEAEDKN